ncbi:MAG: four helix bundle protein [Deltaproteobacteria bacterium]|jgi:four helix bundle protein|nr:four helix bundle protein [Deltaproteobacteria bacterium]MBW2533420.1 four helix bundle protein [Deltaproteobacteria bacterium]
MNDDGLLLFQRMDVYRASRELARQVEEARIRDAELRDQATRAAKRVFLGLCEGLPNSSTAMRRKYFVMADNSLHETLGALDLAEPLGAVSTAKQQAIQALGLQVHQMLRGLMR